MRRRGLTWCMLLTLAAVITPAQALPPLPAGLLAPGVTIRVGPAHGQLDNPHRIQPGTPSISRDGRFVVFTGQAAPYVPSCHGKPVDSRDEGVVLWDRKTGLREYESVGPDGCPGPFNSSEQPAVSDDGRYVVFPTGNSIITGKINPNGDLTSVLVVRDRVTRRTRLITRGYDGKLPNGGVYDPAISGDGRFVVFASESWNLVRGDIPGSADWLHGQIYLSDLKTGKIERIGPSVRAQKGGYGNEFAPSISRDGRIITFAGTGDLLAPSSADVTCAVVCDKLTAQMYSYDRVTRRLQLASVTSIPPADLLTDGLLTAGVAANSWSSSWSGVHSVSGDGRYVVYHSDATNLDLPDDSTVLRTETDLTPDIYRYDRVTRQTKRISVTPGGLPATGRSEIPSISPNGRFIVYLSEASDIVPGKTNITVSQCCGHDQPTPLWRIIDCFVYDTVAGTTRRASVASDGTEADADCLDPVVDDLGEVVFTSLADNLVPGDTNHLVDTFLNTPP